MEASASVVVQEKFKVFVTSDNGFVTDAISGAGGVTTAKECDADIFVGVLYYEEEQEKALEAFKKRIRQLLFDQEQRLTISPKTPVVFVYTGITSFFSKECQSIVENLNAFGRELGVNLYVVTTPIQDVSRKGTEELQAKLKEIISLQKEQLMALRKEKQAQQKAKAQAAVQPSKPSVVLPKVGNNDNNASSVARKKVFIHSNLPAAEEKVVLPKDEDHTISADPHDVSNLSRRATRKEKIVIIVGNENCDVVQDDKDADTIVVIWRTESHTGQKNVTDFLNEVCQKYRGTNKKVIFAFDYGTEKLEPGQRRDQIAHKDSQLEVIRKQALPDNFHLCHTALDFTTGEGELRDLLGTKVSPVNKPVAPKAVISAPVAQHVSFFAKYPQERSRSHSRQVRNKYAEDNLQIKDGDDSSTKKKKLVLSFAHYMSLSHSVFNIGHVNSEVSRSLENELAKNLMPPAEYKQYQDDKDKRRSTFRRCDRVVRRLQKLLLTDNYPKVNDDGFVDNLIKLLSCADTRERRSSAFNTAENQTNIQNIIDAAALAYDKKVKVLVGEEANKQPAKLPWYAQSIYNDLTRPVASKRAAIK